MKHGISDLSTHQSGITLIEVLVALLIMGIGIMGFAALQLRSVETTTVTYSRSQAMAIARDAVERINANPRAWPLGYDESGVNWTAELGENAPVNCVNVAAASACTDLELASVDRYEVRSLAQQMLFGATMRVEEHCGESIQVACVKIAWEGTTLDECDPSGATISAASETDGTANCLIMEFWPQMAVLAEG